MVHTTCLTIAGSDTSGGAGIQSDLRTFTHLGVRGVSAITAVTAQSPRGISAVHSIPADVLSQQMIKASECGKIDAVKIGMIGSAANVFAITLFLRTQKYSNIVIDPVFNATGGAPLLEMRALPIFCEHLLPYAAIVTPNVAEAEALSRMNIRDVASMRKAAKAIYANIITHMTFENEPKVLIKGGHLKGAPVDVLFDGNRYFEIDGERVPGTLHGTGCRLSSALAAYLAKGLATLDAVYAAKAYVVEELKKGQG